MDRPLVSPSGTRVVTALVRCVGLLTSPSDASILGGTPPPSPTQFLNRSTVACISILRLCLLTAGDLRHLVPVEKRLLPLESVETCVCRNFLISIPMALLGSPSTRNTEVMALMAKRLPIFGLLAEVLPRVISTTPPLRLTVVLR